MAELFERSIDKIPFKQFEVLGMSRKNVLSLHPITLSQLLTGKKSSLITFKNIDLQNGMNLTDTAVKISLERQSDSSLALKIHARKEETPSIINDHVLNNEERNQLLSIKNPILAIDIKNAAGVPTKTLVQYDKELNDFTTRNIQPSPNFINGVELTSRDKENFSLGQLIYNKEFGFVRKDLNNPLGYIATSPKNDNVLIFPSNNQNELQKDNILNVASSLKELAELHKKQKDLPYHYSGDAAFLLSSTNLISNSFKKLKEPETQREKAENRLSRMSLSQEIRQIRSMGFAAGMMPLSAIFAYDFIKEALRQRPRDLNAGIITAAGPDFAKSITDDIYSMIPDKIKGEPISKEQKHSLLSSDELSLSSDTKIFLNENGTIQASELKLDTYNQISEQTSIVAESEMEYKSQQMEPIKILPLSTEQRQFMEANKNYVAPHYGLPPITTAQAFSIPDVIDGHKLAFTDKLMLYDNSSVILGNASYSIDKKNDTINKSMLTDGQWNTDTVKAKDVTYNAPGAPAYELNLEPAAIRERYQPLNGQIAPFVEISHLTTSQQKALDEASRSDTDPHLKSGLSLPKPTEEQLQSVPNSINNNEITLQEKVNLLYGNDLIKGDKKYTVNQYREIEKFTLDKEAGNEWRPEGNVMNHDAAFQNEKEMQKHIPSDKIIVSEQVNEAGRAFLKEDFLENNKAFEHNVNLKDLHQESFKQVDPTAEFEAYHERAKEEHHRYPSDPIDVPQDWDGRPLPSDIPESERGNQDFFDKIDRSYDEVKEKETSNAPQRDHDENSLGMDDQSNEKGMKKDKDKDQDNSMGLGM